jgi:hypothetical protein
LSESVEGWSQAFNCKIHFKEPFKLLGATTQKDRCLSRWSRPAANLC